MKRMVVKVGTSTLTYDTGLINLRRIEVLSRVLCDLKNSGIQPILVSSGAIGVGVGKLGLPKRPDTTMGKQAAAAVGQVELMKIYSKLFGEYDVPVYMCVREITGSVNKKNLPKAQIMQDNAKVIFSEFLKEN